MINRRRRPSQPPAALRQNSSHPLFLPALGGVLLIFLYFFFAMERTTQAANYGIEVNIITITWRVLRHFVPVILGALLARSVAISLVQKLYDLPNSGAAQEFLGQLRSDIGIGRIVRAQSQTLEAVRPQAPVLRIGGPGVISIGPGEVGVTEYDGRILRTLPAGRHRLGRFEYLHTVLDLRIQERHIPNIHLVTRDGIEIKANINLTYRLSTGSTPPTRNHPFPYDDDAVRRAAYDQIVFSNGAASNWITVPETVAKSELTKILTKYRLDDVLQPDEHSEEPHHLIHTELERVVHLQLLERGIELNMLDLGPFKFPKEVTKQYIDYWQTQWRIKTDISEAEGEARAQEEVEIARAEAEVIMIQAIVEGIKRAQEEGRSGTVREIVALRLIESLEKVARQSQSLYPLPNELLPRLGQIRRELLPESTHTERSEITEMTQHDDPNA